MSEGQPTKAEILEQQQRAEQLRNAADKHLNRAITTRRHLERIREVNGIKEAIMQRRTR